MRLNNGIARETFQCLDDVVAAHLLKAPEQVSRVIQHNPRIASFSNQLGDNLSKPLVAVSKGLSIVIVALVAMLQHVLQMGDKFSIQPRRNCGLMHMESTGKG